MKRYIKSGIQWVTDREIRNYGGYSSNIRSQVIDLVELIQSYFTSGLINLENSITTALNIVNTPNGNITATNIQDAINELDSTKLLNTLNNRQIFVGNSQNIAVGVTMTGDGVVDSNGRLSINSATTSDAGKVELATNAEVETGTSTTLAVTPANLTNSYIKKTFLTSKGDILSTSDTSVGKLPVGANDTILIADSTQTLGIKWGTIPSNYTQAVGNGEWVISGLDASITILATTHGKGLYPIVKVYSDDGTYLYDSLINTVKIKKSNGDVNIKILAAAITNSFVIIN